MTKMEHLIWLTGASSGIGKAILSYFINNNVNILATSRNVEKLTNEFSSYLNKNLFLEKCDVSKNEQVLSVYNKYKNQFIFDGIINNAGITSFKPFKLNNIEEINSVINTNLLGSIYTVHVLLPELISRNNGLIINILSVAAKKIFTNSSIYAASKAGLLAFSNVLREEVRKNNIRVINVLPGATATPIWSEENLTKYSERMMKPEDVAGLIYSIYKNDSSAVVEELVIRPVLGDL